MIILQQEAHTYRDPILDFVDRLYIQFDFDVAQQKLRECYQVFAIDVFLQPLRAEFIENARLFIFETYCKIHRKIDIRYVCFSGPASVQGLDQTLVLTCVSLLPARRLPTGCSQRSWTWTRTTQSGGLST